LRSDNAATAAAPNDSLRRARALATLLDEAVRIPGTSVRFGVDPLVGLVPGLGDLIGGAASIYIILEAARAGASSSVLLRMAVNVGIDTLVGALPVLGDLFDFAWKSNTRNVRLLARHVEAPAQTKRASRALVVLLVVAILAVVVGVGALTLYLLKRIFS
jgi:hypothetical protein